MHALGRNTRRILFLRNERSQVLHVHARERAQRRLHLLRIVRPRIGKRARTQELRLDVLECCVVRIERLEQFHRLFRLTPARPRLAHDGGNERSSFGVLVPPQVDLVHELFRRFRLAKNQMNHGSLGARFVGDRRHDFLEIDGLERRQGFARVLLHLELRTGEHGGRVVFVEFAFELLQGVLARFGRVGRLDEIRYGPRLLRIPHDPHDERGDAECNDQGDDLGNPPIQDERNDPHDGQRNADTRSQLLRFECSERIRCSGLFLSRGRDERLAAIFGT